MRCRWVLPLLLTLGAPSGFSGSATGSFGIQIQLSGSGAGSPNPTPGNGPTDDGSGVTTCSSATRASGAASSVQVRCNVPTFVQISQFDGITTGAIPADACGEFDAVRGLTCVSHDHRLLAPDPSEGVSLMPAETALRVDAAGGTPAAGNGQLYEIQRRDSLSTLVAVQTLNPDSRTVELLVTF